MKHLFYSGLSIALAVGSYSAAGAQALPSSPAPVARPTFLRLSLGTMPTLNWEYTCPRVALEYAPMLTRHLGVAARLAGVAGRPNDASGPNAPWITQVPDQNYRAGLLEAEGLLYPLGVTHRVRFALGAGGYVARYKHNTVAGAEIVSGQVINYKTATYEGNRAGYLFSLNLEVALGQQRAWVLGLKAARQRGLSGITNLPVHSLTFARQF